MRQWIKFLLIATLILASCKTKETVVKQKAQNIDTFKLPTPVIETANFSKLNVEINNQGDFYTTAASMKIIRDSIIQISIQPILGIEMARLDFYKNEIIIIDKINGKYFKTGYDFLFTNYKIILDYTSLQALFLNELFIVGETSEPYDRLLSSFSKSTFPDGVLVKSKSPNAIVPSEFILNAENNIYYTSITMPLSLITCRYTEFSKTNDINFPAAYKFSLLEGPKTKSAEITIQAVEFNNLVKINMTNLSNFVQVNTFEQLIP